MKLAYIRVPLEPELKHQAEAVLGELGLGLAEAVRLFCRRIVADRDIPFDYCVPNEETIAALQEELSQAKRYDSSQELMEDILSEPDDED